MSDSATPWTVGRQAPLSLEFSRQEYWSGLPFSSPGNLPNPGIKPRSPESQADSLSSAPPRKPCEYMKVNVLDAQSCPTPWTVASQAPLSMGFSRQGHWSGLRALLQGVFPEHRRQTVRHLSHMHVCSLKGFTASPLRRTTGPSQGHLYPGCLCRPASFRPPAGLAAAPGVVL